MLVWYFGTWKLTLTTLALFSPGSLHDGFFCISLHARRSISFIVFASRGFWVGNLGFLGGYIARTHPLFSISLCINKPLTLAIAFFMFVKSTHVTSLLEFHGFHGRSSFLGSCDTNTLYTILVLYLQHLIVLCSCLFGL